MILPPAVVAPAAHAPKVPAAISQAIARDGLNVESSQGWEAVSGPAAKVNDIRTQAVGANIGTLTQYTGANETGQAILIFTGNPGKDAVAFSVGRGAIHSVQNDTAQTWYLSAGRGKPDEGVAGGTATNVRPGQVMATDFPASAAKAKAAGASFSF